MISPKGGKFADFHSSASVQIKTLGSSLMLLENIASSTTNVTENDNELSITLSNSPKTFRMFKLPIVASNFPMEKSPKKSDDSDVFSKVIEHK